MSLWIALALCAAVIVYFSRRQRELLAEYQQLSEESPGPISRSFFEKVREIFG